MAKMTTLKIGQFECVAELQAREGLEEHHVIDLRDQIKRKGGAVPRVKGIEIDDPEDTKHHGKTYVYDGHHTIEAYMSLDRTMIPFAVIFGTWQNARDEAAKANAGHKALKRSSKTKRRAIKMMLQDHPDWTDPTVARHTQTSPGLVADVRPEVPLAAEAKTRVGLDGKVRKATQKPKARRAEATSNGTPAKQPEPETFDWKLFDSHFGWVVKATDALESSTGNKVYPASARIKLQAALDAFNELRNLTSKEK